VLFSREAAEGKGKVCQDKHQRTAITPGVKH